MRPLPRATSRASVAAKPTIRNSHKWRNTMLKSLMLATACAYINPPGLTQAPMVQATSTEILKQAYAMEPGTQKEIIIDHGDGLCSKVVIEASTDEALNAFIVDDREAAPIGLVGTPWPPGSEQVETTGGNQK